MTTLYEQFNAVRTAQKNWLYEPDVQQKLIDIFKIICDIDLSDQITPFKNDGGSFGMEIVYNYKFKYGRVYVQTEKTEMQVMFIFDDPYDLTLPFSRPSCSHRCTVKVDHDLNFVEARFGFYTSFSNRSLDRDVSGFLLLCFERVINSNKSFNSIAYSPDMLADNYLDLIPHHLHKNYLIPNIEFERVFMEFMTFCSENPEDFYNVFVEYPNYEQIISNVDKFVLFLNLFNQQYIENSALLQSRILLLTMQTI